MQNYSGPGLGAELLFLCKLAYIHVRRLATLSPRSSKDFKLMNYQLPLKNMGFLLPRSVPGEHSS